MKTPIDQQNSAIDQNFPEHLRSYESLEQHFREKLDGLSTTEKGDRFVHFVQKLVPQVEIGSDFDIPELAEKKSGDEGVDLIAQGKDGHSILYIQARLWIDSSETIDSIVSKFKAYLATHHSKLLSQPYLFKIPDQTPHSDNPTPHFLVITLSSLKGIRRRYEEREFASKSFYQQLVAEDRIHFIDGHQILSILQAAYSKISDLPTNLVLNLETPPIRKDNVFFGIISSTELQKLYNQFGDALFFENIRDFLGLEKDRERKGITTPNDEIVKTIKNYHTKMLERNNGIVIRADEVKQGQPSSQLILRSLRK